MIEINQKLPNISLHFDNGEVKNINDFKGQKLILFFYPKDSTSGCTKEACSINYHYKKLLDLGYQAIGISPQNAKSKQKFRDQNDLIMPLVCDEDTSICQAFGLWQEKKLYGRTYMGVVRTTYIIDEDGVVTHIIPKVNVSSHGEDLVHLLEK